ncbi:hypothetical protein DRQ25_11255 [Candidatus Fermentibacteria bacterium]|nr:MAG: hypothetical protein DRQ25_11255 [Candidatus Fermentibacteria bacterium]
MATLPDNAPYQRPPQYQGATAADSAIQMLNYQRGLDNAIQQTELNNATQLSERGLINSGALATGAQTQAGATERQAGINATNLGISGNELAASNYGADRRLDQEHAITGRTIAERSLINQGLVDVQTLQSMSDVQVQQLASYANVLESQQQTLRTVGPNAVGGMENFNALYQNQGVNGVNPEMAAMIQQNNQDRDIAQSGSRVNAAVAGAKAGVTDEDLIAQGTSPGIPADFQAAENAIVDRKRSVITEKPDQVKDQKTVYEKNPETGMMEPRIVTLTQYDQIVSNPDAYAAQNMYLEPDQSVAPAAPIPELAAPTDLIGVPDQPRSLSHGPQNQPTTNNLDNISPDALVSAAAAVMPVNSSLGSVAPVATNDDLVGVTSYIKDAQAPFSDETAFNNAALQTSVATNPTPATQGGDLQMQDRAQQSAIMAVNEQHRQDGDTTPVIWPGDEIRIEPLPNGMMRVFQSTPEGDAYYDIEP